MKMHMGEKPTVRNLLTVGYHLGVLGMRKTHDRNARPGHSVAARYAEWRIFRQATDRAIRLSASRAISG